MINTNNKILLYGGTFDPPHASHVNNPFIAAKNLGINAIIFIPSGNPPHKQAETSGIQRYTMLDLALKDQEPIYRISDFEIIGRKKPKYTYLTLEYLHSRLKSENPSFYLLVGADQALEFDSWRKPELITELCTPVAMLRPPYIKKDLEKWPFDYVEVPQEDISSTELRKLLKDKKYDHEKVVKNMHPEVIDYIKKYKLYV